MRLLLDEMHPASIAEGLRARGHDAVGIVERREMRAMTDGEVFAAAQTEGRAVVTENVADYVRLANDHDTRARAHHGLMLVHPARYPRGNPRTVGTMIGAIDLLARRFPSDEPTSLRSWL